MQNEGPYTHIHTYTPKFAKSSRKCSKNGAKMAETCMKIDEKMCKNIYTYKYTYTYTYTHTHIHTYTHTHIHTYTHTHILHFSGPSICTGTRASRVCVCVCVNDFIHFLSIFIHFSSIFAPFLLHFGDDLGDFGGSGARPAKNIEKRTFQAASWRPSGRQDAPSWSQDGAKLANLAPRCAQDGQLGG